LATGWHVYAALCTVVVAAAMAMSAGLIAAVLPTLRRYALARPNERSSHTRPTPQGGGVAVVTATILATCAALSFVDAAPDRMVLVVLAATAFIALLGMIDDIRAVPVAPRLLLQAAAVGAVIAALPVDFRVAEQLPWSLERGLVFVGGLWFVNLVNFMDGIDWMTVVEVIPLSAGMILFGLMGALPPDGLIVAAALFGATLGFAPFNRPVARLFLGDVGSLPIGLLGGWLLVLLAGSGHLAAAILLPLYYLADATITLLRLARHRQPVWRAHRKHYYQRAFDQGLPARQIVSRVFTVNVALATLATFTVLDPSIVVDLVALVAGAALVAGILVLFAKGR
jgi:UDP-N-acetylmuramyl pentapeptide phosphotransferase/UDP-N-acetylglucosamine-1-phosphate transferase